MNTQKDIAKVIKALGAVYGDIGTSPLYTLAVLVVFVPLTPNNVIEILSMIFWTLILLVTVQYSWLAMRITSHGEGGAIVLAQTLKSKITNPKLISFLTIISILSVALLMGDGVITPAISILSAVEGTKLISSFKNIQTETIVLISLVITFVLFWVQHKGIDKISGAFGWVMLVWFLTIGFIGFINILSNPHVLIAVNPIYAIDFLIHYPVISFVMLGSVILCATGGEALYADMGQLGREPIIQGWIFVFVSLILCYFGQGAYIILHANDANNPLFAMVEHVTQSIYAPFVILAVMATIIASQAMISGVFSMVYQLINIKLLPRLKVTYTSDEMRSQIYVGFINWLLFALVALILIVFKTSDSLANAYGLSVAGAMCITAWFLFFIYLLEKDYTKTFFAFLCTITATSFFASCLLKLPSGGYFSALIAISIFLFIIMYINGQKKLYSALKTTSQKDFVSRFKENYQTKPKIEGNALFLARKLDEIPAYITKTMFDNGIIYENNYLVMLKISEEARSVTTNLIKLENGLNAIIVNIGYMEILHGRKILESYNIQERAIFYGFEEIRSKNFIWSLFAIVKLLTPSFVSFYRLPKDRLIGITRRVEI